MKMKLPRGKLLHLHESGTIPSLVLFLCPDRNLSVFIYVLKITVSFERKINI